MDITLLADYTPFVLILGGIVATSWLLEKIVRPTPVVGNPIGGLMKIVSLFGFFVGILLLVTAASVWSLHAWDSGTKYLLIITGLALLLKPLKDIPFAALIGLIVGGLCVGLVFFLFTLPETILGISSTWIYLAIFLIPAVIAYIFFKFIEDLVKLIGTFLASRPVSLALGVICIIQGILLLANISLFALIP